MKRDIDIWDPFRIMRRRMLDVFSGFPFEEGIRQPLTDVVDKGNEIVVTAELPGVEKNDIELRVEDDSVSINAESKSETKEEKPKKGYFFHERSYSKYSRVIPLPAEIVKEKTEAEFKNGILRITLPKKHPEEPSEKGFKVEIK